MVLGIDPGLINTGYGIVSFVSKKNKVLDCGVISPKTDESLSRRLNTIYNDVLTLISKYKPESISLEEVFYGNNVKTTLKLGQARASVLIAAAEQNIEVYEYTPRKIKLSITGHGSSHKEQVKFMVENHLNINLTEAKDDVSDALAAALCHEQQFRYRDL